MLNQRASKQRDWVVPWAATVPPLSSPGEQREKPPKPTVLPLHWPPLTHREHRPRPQRTPEPTGSTDPSLTYHLSYSRVHTWDKVQFTSQAQDEINNSN